MKKQFVGDILSGKIRSISDVFAVRVKKPPVPYRTKKGTWFEMRVADKTGEIAAKFWGSENAERTMELYDTIPADGIVHISGTAEPYKDALQIAIKNEGLRPCSTGEYDMADFISASSKNIDEMFDQLSGVIESIKNEQLKALLESFFGDADFAQLFKKTPAAMSYHQNWTGGLLEHVLNIIEICETIARVHPDLDRDLLLCGAILHDIGKVREFEMSTTIKVSKEGQLIGHIVIGYEMAKEKINSMEFSENLRHKVLHMILSHQGKLEFASPKEPMIPEAVALYYADEIDSKTAYMLAAKKSANTESAWIWDKRLGRSIYLE